MFSLKYIDLQKSTISRFSRSPFYSVDYAESEEGDKEFSSESDSVASSLHEAPGPLFKHNKK